MNEVNKVSNAIKISFDVNYNPEEPTLILARKNGDKLGKINAKAIEVSDNMNSAPEITFSVNKYIDNEKDILWDLITNFKLVYCVEWNCWFEAVVEIDESNETVKTVFCTRLGEAELSQIMLYNIEINTEVDIEREDYVIPTVLYRENGVLGEGITESDVKFYKEVEKEDMTLPFEGYKESSLLHRILKDKAPHYSIAHVDSNLQHMQREFTFDGTSIYDACQEIAEELNCLFVFDSCSDDKGNIQRTISVYDLESNCKSCGNRDEFSDVCPECGNVDIDDGYGEDTTIFVTSDEIADDIQLTTDTDAMKNCFKLEAGDDLMTATIKNCNPNGSDYIWYLSDEMKEDMSDELVSAIEAYDILYKDYQSGSIQLDESLVEKYNDLVDKYNEFMKIDDGDKLESSDRFEKVDNPVNGFPSLIDAYYNMFDMHLYLKSGLMPTVNTARPSIDEEVAKLTVENLSPVAVNLTSSSTDPLKASSVMTVDNLVQQMAKSLVDPRYKIEILDGSILGFYEVDNYTEDEKGNKTFNYVVDADGNKNYLEDTSENKREKYVDGQPKYWRGKIKIIAVSDKELFAETENVLEIEVNDDYETFVRNKLDKALSSEDVDDLSISSLFKKKLASNDFTEYLATSDDEYLTDNDGNDLVAGEDYEDSFQYALKEYSFERLEAFHNTCLSCVELLIEIGAANRETWGDKRMCIPCSESEEEVFTTNIKTSCPNPDCEYDKEFIMSCPECGYVGDSVNTCEKCGSSDIDYSLDLYTMLYADYVKKLAAIQDEMNVRSNEMAVISGIHDEDGNVIEDGLQTIIEKIKADIQDKLNFEKFLLEYKSDDNLWYEFCSFRREDKYSNDNYISEGKNNAEIITLANEFIETAKKEIYKSAELQCSISASLKNLLVIEKFKPLVNNFRVGNWIRVMVDDKVYKLRLISYTIDYDSLDSISVEFSDVVRANSSIKSVKDVLEQASSMATSYPAVQRQAKQGEESKSTINNWFDSGLDATNVKIVGGADGQCQTWDNHGMLFREYDDATGDYSPDQMKIINSTMAITTDNWKTTKTAVGKYYYNDPRDGNKLKMAYGINAETIVGKLIIGETIELNNSNGTMTFDDNGLVVRNEINTVTIDPDNESILNIKNGDSNILSFNQNGDLIIVGDIKPINLDLEEAAEAGNVTGLADVALSGKYDELVGDYSKSGQVLSLNDANGVSATTIAKVAKSGSYNDLIDRPSLFSGSYNDLTDKPTIPTTSDSILQDDNAPVSGSAVYNYAVAKNQGLDNAGRILYIDASGNVTAITIDSLKNLLGIT